MESYNSIHTVVVTGHKEAGKSTLIQKLTRNRLTKYVDTHYGVDTYIYRYCVGLREVLFHICETSGNECHTPSVFQKYIDNSDGIIIVHDVTSKMNKSLECTCAIIREIIRNAKCKNVEMFLACNKFDRINGKRTMKEEKKVARKHNMTLFRTSATQTENVYEMFESVFNRIWYRNLLRDPDYPVKNFNVLIVGDRGVGKTSLVQQFSKNKFSENIIEHPDIFQTSCQVIVNEQLILLTVREGPDTGEFRNVIRRYYEDIHGVVLVYDMCNRNTFSNAQKWIQTINGMVNAPFIPKFMVGNKSDHIPNVEVAFEEANIVAKKEGYELYQTSAKENLIVFEVFNQMSQFILKQHDRNNLSQRKGCFSCFLNHKKPKLQPFLFPTSQPSSTFPTPITSIQFPDRSISLYCKDSINERDLDSICEENDTLLTALSRTASEEIASLLQMSL